ncbi:MAG: hypothetical protein AB7S38_26695 [Vulcanimicrobiota bacterium]
MNPDIRAEYQQQINELFRLADEAESCARIMRQQAERFQESLDDGSITEEALKSMMEEREKWTLRSDSLRVTDSLM